MKLRLILHYNWATYDERFFLTKEFLFNQIKDKTQL